MSPPVLGPEAMAIASNLLREPLRCRELLPLQPSPTCARHLGLLVLLTGANQHRVIPPASYGGVYDIYPRTQSAVTLYRGGSRGEGCQPPYFIRSSIITYYRHSPQRDYQFDPTGSPSFLSRSWVFSYSLVILYQSGQEKSS